MTDHARLAKENFIDGCNCAQAVLSAYSELTGLDRETSLRLASSFGGGMGRLRLTCGAVVASEMVLGLLRGYSDIEDPEKKKAHYAEVRELAARFEAEWGTLNCKQLLERLASKPVTALGDPDARTEEYYKVRPCVRIVESAARILDDYLKEKNK